jgi:prepilin peptidase CpaA
MVGLGLFILPFMLGGIGGGDVKLFAALGAWMGAELVAYIGLFAAVAGGIMAFFILLRRGGFGRFCGVTGIAALEPTTARTGTSPRRNWGRFSYTIPILSGLATYCVLRWAGCM